MTTVTNKQIRTAAKDGKISNAEAKKLGLDKTEQKALNRDIKDGGKLTAKELKADVVEAPKDKAKGPELKPATPGQVDKADDAADAIHDTVEKLDDARGDAAKLDAKLNQELAEVGPGLSNEQIAKYEDEFRKRHEDVYGKVPKLEDELSKQLAEQRALLESAALAGDKKAADKLQDGYEALAKSAKHADEAIRWVSSLGSPGKQKVHDAIDKLTSGKLNDDLRDKILAPAIPNAQSEIFSRNYDRETAADKMGKLLGPLGAAKGLGDIPGQIRGLEKAIERGVENGHYDNVQTLLKGFKEKNAFGKAIAVASVAQCAYGAGEDLKSGKLAKAITSTLGASEATLELSAGVLGTFKGAAKVAGKAAGLAARLAPGVGLVLDSKQLGDEIGAALKDKSNAGKWVQAFGTAVSLVGDIAGFVPGVGTVLDGVLGGIGAGINAIGGLVSKMITGDKETKQRKNEEVAILQKATNLNAKDARELANTGADDLSRLKALGLSAKEIQALAANDKIDLSSKNAAMMIRTCALFDKKGDAAQRLFKEGMKLLEGKHGRDIDVNLDRATYGFVQGQGEQGWRHRQEVAASAFLQTGTTEGRVMAAKLLGVPVEKVGQAMVDLELRYEGLKPRSKYNPPEPNLKAWGDIYDGSY